MPRQLLRPPQCGWISTTPFRPSHWVVKLASVMSVTIDEAVTVGLEETPPSQAKLELSPVVPPPEPDAVPPPYPTPEHAYDKHAFHLD